MEEHRLVTKDYLLIVLFSLMNICIHIFSSLMYSTSITIIMMPLFFALLQGIFFYMIAFKIQKRNALLIYCILQGLLTFNFVYILVFTLAGIISELIIDRFGMTNTKTLALAYVLTQILASIGSTYYPLIVNVNTTLSHNINYADQVVKASTMLNSWLSIALLFAIIIVSIIGAEVGKRVTYRHIINQK